jgi:hypothetical protein
MAGAAPLNGTIVGFTFSSEFTSRTYVKVVEPTRRDEFHLAALVQNLKTLAPRMLGPPPQRTPAFVA